MGSPARWASPAVRPGDSPLAAGHDCPPAASRNPNQEQAHRRNLAPMRRLLHFHLDCPQKSYGSAAATARRDLWCRRAAWRVGRKGEADPECQFPLFTKQARRLLYGRSRRDACTTTIDPVIIAPCKSSFWMDTRSTPATTPGTPSAELGELTVYDRTPAGQVVDRAGTAEIVLTNKTLLDGPMLAGLPALRFISVLATGYNVVDVAAARRQGIVVSNVPEYGTDSVAQHVDRPAPGAGPSPGAARPLGPAGPVAAPRRLLVLGRPAGGAGGQADGHRGFRADRPPGRPVGPRPGHGGAGLRRAAAGSPPDYRPLAWRSLEAIFAEADVISLHCPLGPDNQGMVNRRGWHDEAHGAADQHVSRRAGQRARPGRRPERGPDRRGGDGRAVPEPPAADNPLLARRTVSLLRTSPGPRSTPAAG